MLLDARGMALAPSHPTGRNWYANEYCPVTLLLLGNVPEERRTEFDQQIKVYIESGTEPDSMGVRVPLVFWLVMADCISPQQVLSAMTGENVGVIDFKDLRRLFGERWVLESLIANWSKRDWVFKKHNIPQREFHLGPVKLGQPHSKTEPCVTANGALLKYPSSGNGGTYHLTVDEFTHAALYWSQKSAHIAPGLLAALTNESVLDAYLSRPKLLEGHQYNDLTELALRQRWHDLVKCTLRTLVMKNGGPGTAQLVFDGIAKGLNYFRDHT